MADSSSTTSSTVGQRWGDVEDDPVEVEESTSQTPENASSSSAVEVPNLDALAIDENKKKNDFLDEPEDTHISAVTSGDTLYATAAKFEDLNLSPELLKGLYVDMKFTRPSKIQSISLPMILTPPYKDLVAQAHNGSGKTTCFVLGMLSRVDPNLKEVQALCICPTRELAIQNMEVLNKMGKYTGISSVCAIPSGSADIPIAKSAEIKAQVVIGTPGRIRNLMTSRKLNTSNLKVLVFDEADHMLDDDGFKDDSLKIRRLMAKDNAHYQVLLFSATFNDTVKNFVSKVVKDGNQMFVRKEELTLDVVKQYKVICPNEQAKIDVIRDRIFELGEKLGQTIIFVHSRKSANELHKKLGDYGYGCTTIHGALDKDFRDKIVKEFKDGLTKVLISTDVLARGFDQSQVNLVINFDLPVKHNYPSDPDYEVYLHRCGRAGRFGRKGAVFNLLSVDMDHMLLEKIEKHFGTKIVEVPNWKSDEDFEKALKAAGLL
ncbi:Dead-box atp-dependent rna helicase [Thalictrum thalictroides]|uniref:RNA helicase n=1 Tax=Thalictrum thalictroides TaxID=46969 RepID=A0A7J6X3A2_THATH|nr:Dead-box atp-dependent rna helicase [Thalictrum thalictroides]